MKSIILCLGLLGFTVGVKAQSMATLKVTVSEIESDEGTLRVGLYDNAGDWLESIYMGKDSSIEKGRAEVVFDEVPYGVYAVAVYHDENDNGKMDMFLGFFPREDHACSNQAPSNYGPPKWKDAKFSIDQKTNHQIIKL